MGAAGALEPVPTGCQAVPWPHSPRGEEITNVAAILQALAQTKRLEKVPRSLKMEGFTLCILYWIRIIPIFAVNLRRFGEKYR
jgi:hypothetical protein